MRIGTVWPFVNVNYLLSRKRKSYQTKKAGRTASIVIPFNQGNPNEMVMHMRKINAGTILIQGGACQKLNTKTPHTISNFVYPDWHPSGKQIAFSTNLTQMSFYDAHP